MNRRSGERYSDAEQAALTHRQGFVLLLLLLLISKSQQQQQQPQQQLSSDVGSEHTKQLWTLGSRSTASAVTSKTT